MKYALVNLAGSILRIEDFDGAAPQLAAGKGLRWLPVAAAPAHDAETHRLVETVGQDEISYVIADLDAPTQAARRAEWVAQVDLHIAGLYARWTRFETEYREREAAARAFAAAGYTGDPGVWVSRFAQNTGHTNRQAADLIIGQADALRAALYAIGNLRMDKYLILSAATLAAAKVKRDEIIAAANAAVAGM